MTTTPYQEYISTGHSINAKPSRWTFGEEVSKSFDQHVEASVPMYKEGHSLVCEISDFFIPTNGNVLDLGCSTGTLLGQLSNRHEGKNVTFLGLDPVEEMINMAKLKNSSHKMITFSTDDFLEIETSNKFDFSISYLTLQFIPASMRQRYIDKLYADLNWGGALVIFDKVRAPDARFQDICTALYTEFKLAKGFTPDNIIAKSRALKGIQDPFSSIANIEGLQRAGFKDIMTIWKYVNFEAFIAIK